MHPKPSRPSPRQSNLPIVPSLSVPRSRITTLPREERDEAIRSLLRRGFSIRQIERLSGIGRGVIQRLRASLDG